MRVTNITCITCHAREPRCVFDMANTRFDKQYLHATVTV